MSVEVHDLEVRIQKILDRIARDNEGTKFLVLSDGSGLPVAALESGAKTISATASATMALAVGRNIALNLGLEGQPEALFESPGWKVIVWPLGGGLSLLGVFEERVNLGFLRLAVRRWMAELREVVVEFL